MTRLCFSARISPPLPSSLIFCTPPLRSHGRTLACSVKLVMEAGGGALQRTFRGGSSYTRRRQSLGSRVGRRLEPCHGAGLQSPVYQSTRSDSSSARLGKCQAMLTSVCSPPTLNCLSLQQFPVPQQKGTPQTGGEPRPLSSGSALVRLAKCFTPPFGPLKKQGALPKGNGDAKFE